MPHIPDPSHGRHSLWPARRPEGFDWKAGMIFGSAYLQISTTVPVSMEMPCVLRFSNTTKYDPGSSGCV